LEDTLDSIELGTPWLEIKILTWPIWKKRTPLNIGWLEFTVWKSPMNSTDRDLEEVLEKSRPKLW